MLYVADSNHLILPAFMVPNEGCFFFRLSSLSATIFCAKNTILLMMKHLYSLPENGTGIKTYAQSLYWHMAGLNNTCTNSNKYIHGLYIIIHVATHKHEQKIYLRCFCEAALLCGRFTRAINSTSTFL